MKVSKSEMALNRFQNRPQQNLGRTDMVDNIVNSMFEYESSNRNIDKIVAQIDEFRENLAMQTKVSTVVISGADTGLFNPSAPDRQI